MNKINKYILIGATALSLWIWTNDIKAQTADTNQKICENFSPQENNTVTIRNKKDLPKEITDHEEFINTNIYELAIIYWKEKAIRLINEHMLIELNKYRIENWKTPLKLSQEVKKLSQDYANYLFKTNKDNPPHWEWEKSLQARIKQAGINCWSWWEVLLAWATSTKDAFEDWKDSYEHNKTLLLDNFTFCWLGVDFTDIKDGENSGTDDWDWELVFIWNKAYLKKKKTLYSVRNLTLIWN